MHSWIREARRTANLYRWWSEGGAESSAIAFLLPAVLSNHERGQMACGCGQAALRSGAIKGAIMNLRKASELMPDDFAPLVAMRLELRADGLESHVESIGSPPCGRFRKV